MADIKDVSTVIASALNEIGMHGTLDVEMDGAEAVEAVGERRGEEVEVLVQVRPAEPAR